MPSASANPDALDRLLRSSFSTGKTPGLHISRVKATFKANRHNLLQLYLLSNPPIPTEISRVAKGQVGVSMKGPLTALIKQSTTRSTLLQSIPEVGAPIGKLLKNIQSSIRGLCTCK
jgi:hypothetical protein